MPIEIRELTIKAIVSKETATTGDSDASQAAPPGTGKTLTASLLGKDGADGGGDAADLVADGTQASDGVCHGVTVLAWARVDGTSPSGDDVVVDGRIITAENPDSAYGDGSVHFISAGIDPVW